ncbi:MAG TPA: uroporphyrinogen decarboxylase family protein, partial [Armatimonadota bacterium]|nr:uroporphyrinogen decarboxylase family protein [Armatimonadota bacterium]
LKTGLSPVEIWHDPQVYAESLLRTREMYGFDGILVSVPGGDPDWREKIADTTEEPKGIRVRYSEAPLNRSPYAIGAEASYPNDDLPQPAAPEPFPAIDGLGIDEIDTLDPVPDWMLKNLRAVKASAGDEWSIHGETFSPFDKILELMGMQNGLISIVDDPAKTHQVLGKGLEYAANWGVAQAREGCDAMKISSPYVGNAFLSRDMYLEYVQPYEAELIDRMREAAPEMPIYTHTCGAISDRLELLADSGVDGIECLDPPPLGDVELSDAVARVGERIFIKGNIDSVNTLLFKKPDDVRADVEEVCRAGMAADGFVLSTACSIAPGVPQAHVRIVSDVAREIGEYA